MLRASIAAAGALAVAVVLAFSVSGGSSKADPPSSVSPFDENYLQTAIQGDRFEVIGGRLAKRRGHSVAVRALGARLLKDHKQSLKDAIDLANKLDIDVPKKPTPLMQWELRAVRHFHGRAFDRWYTDLEVQDHKQDIKEASDETSKGSDPELKKSAADELPTLREHLKLSRAARKSVR